MTTLFLISYFALWGLFLLQSLAILVLLRQVGVLHLRIGPSGARIMPAGPEIGQQLPSLTLVDIDDPAERFDICQDMEEDVLLLFVSPSCAACATLMPAIKPLVAESNGEIRWIMIASGGRERCRMFRRQHGLDFLFFAYDPEISDRFKLTLTPYAVLVRKDGIAFSKGLVNQIEHLESILETRNDSRNSVSKGTGDLTSFEA